jgi:putative glycerol-1-phosphate prenyltransferase
MGAKLIYLEAGSGAKFPVKPEIISEVKKAINIPLIVGGGIKTEAQKNTAYEAGADMVVMGTAFE